MKGSCQTYALMPPYYARTDSTTLIDSVLDTWITNMSLQPVNAYLHALNRAIPHWILQHGGGGGSDSAVQPGYGIVKSIISTTITLKADTTSGNLKLATQGYALRNGGAVNANDSVGTDSAHIYINGHSRLLEQDTVYRVGSGNKGAGNGVAITLKYTNCSDGETIRTLYYKATTKYSQITFPSAYGGVAYTIAQSGHYSTVSGQTVTFETTTGTSIYEIITNVTKYRFIISIVWIQ